MDTARVMAALDPTEGRTGHLQRLLVGSRGDRVVITDDLYGTHVISEPVLVELLTSSKALRRLGGINQAGITSFLGLTPAKVTRLEHSIGAFLLVRHVGGKVDEQVAALLHDISHTAFSHVVDYALSLPGEDSFHEVHKMRYVMSTEIPDILMKHGFEDLRPLYEELYPLVERPAPHLCADRLDYGLRDAFVFGMLRKRDVDRILSTLRAHPDVVSQDRMLVMRGPKAAHLLAKAYMDVDQAVWSNPAHIDLYKRSGKLIGDMVRRGAIPEEKLWSLSDNDFWAELRKAADGNEQAAMAALMDGGLPSDEGLLIPKYTKVRTIDPDVCTAIDLDPVPLSTRNNDWAEERAAYLPRRKHFGSQLPKGLGLNASKQLTPAVRECSRWLQSARQFGIGSGWGTRHTRT